MPRRIPLSNKSGDPKFDPSSYSIERCKQLLTEDPEGCSALFHIAREIPIHSRRDATRLRNDKQAQKPR